MFRINKVLWIITLFFLNGYVSASARQKHTFMQKEMGSPFTITIYTKDSLKAARVAHAAFDEVNRLNTIFSDYLDSSELNRLCLSSGTNRYIEVSPELFFILKLSLQASQISLGAFDISVGPLVRIWRQARKQKQFPRQAVLQKAKHAVGYRYIHLDTLRQSVWLEAPDMQLDLGGIAKGYAAQAALDVVRDSGFSCAMVNAGGDLTMGSAPPARQGWRIGIGNPESYDEVMSKYLVLKNKAVATSGDIYQYFEWKGKRYSHIIDPKTGYGVTFQRNVTVIADKGATADWLASACSILSIPESLKLIAHTPGAAVLIAEKRGDSIYRVSSDNFKSYFER